VLLYIAIAVLAWLVWYLSRRGQGRVAAAFVLAPVLVSVFFYGPLGLVGVLPIALLVTAVLATPLYFMFRRRGWLKWWQVGLAGLLCGVAFALLFDSTSPQRLDALGIEDALNFGGVGMLVAIVFWWLALYRNRAFPAIPRSLPYAMLILIPLVISGVLVHRSFYTTFTAGPNYRREGRGSVTTSDSSVIKRVGGSNLRFTRFAANGGTDGPVLAPHEPLVDHTL
jgi:hypothetical protein